ncbi:MAG TPA: type II toxin-antitoxin system RelE/ParE family toxin [Candidatus Nanoarchaeia archaeon]|nr:type II toxin-antitoxin system RelE/ParE family toxin [Candidatus Nanoarchaeia archaeon]
MLRVELGNPAKRFLKSCDPILIARLVACMESLAIDPFPSGVVRVKDRGEKTFRVRVGKYRIVYTVDHGSNLLLVTDIDKRSRVYK